jgi:aryl-alcohol dehydrogenase-like predicted oxidoreductase
LSGIQVSAVSFGAGPVAQLLTSKRADSQRRTIEAALDAGINWFDTAATYGDGQSESNLGRVLAELGAAEGVHVATKVRIMPEQLADIRAAVRESVTGSLKRLRLERVTLVQVHNSITCVAGAQPTSLAPGHVLGAGGVLEELQRLQRQGLIGHLGLTALGETAALGEVIAGGAFTTIQVPYSLLNPSAGQTASDDFPEDDYANVITTCAARGMGTFAIRVLAGGALAGRPPSPHTLKTRFFPLELYERDCRRAERLKRALPAGMKSPEAAVRFVLSHPGLTSAIIGFAAPQEVEEITRFAAAGPLDVAPWGGN